MRRTWEMPDGTWEIDSQGYFVGPEHGFGAVDLIRQTTGSIHIYWPHRHGEHHYFPS